MTCYWETRRFVMWWLPCPYGGDVGVILYSPVSAAKVVLQLLRGPLLLYLDHLSSWFDHADEMSVSWSQN